MRDDGRDGAAGAEGRLGAAVDHRLVGGRVGAHRVRMVRVDGAADRRVQVAEPRDGAVVTSVVRHQAAGRRRLLAAAGERQQVGRMVGAGDDARPVVHQQIVLRVARRERLQRVR